MLYFVIFSRGVKMDKYYEQLTPAYKNGFYGILKYLYIVLAVLAVFGLLTSLWLLGILFGVLSGLSYFAKRKGCREYEYTFTSGDLDIDVIYEAQRRKKVMSFNMNDVAMMAPEGSSYLDGMKNGKKIDAYPKDTKEKLYVAVINKNSSVSNLYFIPDEELINLCFRSNPRNVKKKDYIG